jgi:hypothetical protein
MAHPKADFTRAQALVKFLFWNLHFKAAIVRLFFMSARSISATS